MRLLSSFGFSFNRRPYNVGILKGIVDSFVGGNNDADKIPRDSLLAEVLWNLTNCLAVGRVQARPRPRWLESAPRFQKFNLMKGNHAFNSEPDFL